MVSPVSWLQIDVVLFYRDDNLSSKEFLNTLGRADSTPSLDDFLSYSAEGQHKPTNSIDRTAASSKLEDFLPNMSYVGQNDNLKKMKPQRGKRMVGSPVLKDFVSNNYAPQGQKNNQTKALDQRMGCCHFEKLIQEIQGLASEIQKIKSDMPKDLEKKFRSLIPAILKQHFCTNTQSPALKTSGLTPNSRKKRPRTLNFEQNNGNNNLINVSDLEDDSVQIIKSFDRCSGAAAPKSIIKFLFDEKLDTSYMVVDFGRVHLNRSEIKCLQPKQCLLGPVIDCVVYMASMNDKAKHPGRPSLFLGSRFAEYILKEKSEDADLYNMFLRDDEVFKNEKLDQIYIPINDMQGHWYLAIIDVNISNISICDTRPVALMKDIRRDQVTKIANKLGQLIGRGDIGNTFLYDYPRWVPLQTNKYDCGLYVCLILLIGEKMDREFDKEDSAKARCKLAVDLYKDPSNNVAWD